MEVMLGRVGRNESKEQKKVHNSGYCEAEGKGMKVTWLRVNKMGEMGPNVSKN